MSPFFDQVFITLFENDIVGFDKMLNNGLDINTVYASSHLGLSSLPPGYPSLPLVYNNGETLLTFFTKNSDENNVELLLMFGADPNVKNMQGYTPLILACCQAYQNINIVKLLLKYGANANIKSGIDLHPLRFAMANFNVDIITILLEYGADINAKSNGYNMLDLYWRCENAGMVTEFLVKNGAILSMEEQFLPDCDCFHCYNNIGYSTDFDDDSDYKSVEDYGLSDDEESPK